LTPRKSHFVIEVTGGARLCNSSSLGKISQSFGNIQVVTALFFPFPHPFQHDTPKVTFMTENHARLSPALVETIAGLSAGTISTLAVHPLDVIKTRLQSSSPIPMYNYMTDGLQSAAPHQTAP